MIFQQQFKGATPVFAIYSSRESVEAGGLISSTLLARADEVIE